MTRVALTLALTALGGCAGRPAALDPAGPQAARIAGFWWLLLAVSIAVSVVVLAVLLDALARRRGGGLPPTPAVDPGLERRLTFGVAAAVVLTAVLLLSLFVASLRTARALNALGEPDALTVEVTGHQWWWEVEYWDSAPARRVRTANEIHVPVGRPVLVKTRSADVIHSLWAPRLAGKKDLLPQHATSLWMQADRPGMFDGQCAEFCGHQHAHMRLTVVAEAPEAFQTWLAHQRTPAAEPTEPALVHGREVFLAGPCALCHTIAGTTAAARLGPDLTHFASRTTLAAGTLPNDLGALAAWLVDPQSVKPGVHMPPAALPPRDFQALVAYLGSLR